MSKVKLTAEQREEKRKQQREQLASTAAAHRRSTISKMILGHVVLNHIAKACNDPIETIVQMEPIYPRTFNPFAVPVDLPPEEARQLVKLWLMPSELEWRTWPVSSSDSLMVPEVTFDLIDALKAVVIAEPQYHNSN